MLVRSICIALTLAGSLSAAECRPLKGNSPAAIVTVTGLMADGDSITSGTYAGGAGTTYPQFLGQITGFTVANSGVPSAWLSTSGNPSIIGAYAAAGHPGNAMYNSGSRNTLIIMGGTNDIVNGTAAATVEGLIIQYCNLAKATGWQVAVATIIPGTAYASFSVEPVRVTVNTWIRANYRSFASVLVDFDAISVFNPPVVGTYFTDLLHPSVLGNEYMAARALADLGLTGIPQSNTAVPVITGHVQTGNTLTASTGTWTNYLTPTYSYQWSKNAVAIGGATSSSYVVVSGDVGQSITVTVTDTSLYAAVNATSTAASP